MDTTTTNRDESFDNLVALHARRQSEILHSTGYRHAAGHVRQFVDDQVHPAGQQAESASAQ